MEHNNDLNFKNRYIAKNLVNTHTVSDGMKMKGIFGKCSAKNVVLHISTNTLAKATDLVIVAYFKFWNKIMSYKCNDIIKVEGSTAINWNIMFFKKSVLKNRL